MHLLARYTPLILAVATAAISFVFTIRACLQISPIGTPYELCALGIIWEWAKLYMAPKAFARLASQKTHPWLGRAGYVAVLAMAAVLMAGTVGATYLATTQADAASQQAVTNASVDDTRSSPPYQELVADMDAYTARMNALIALQQRQVADNHRTRATETDEKIALVQLRREEVRAQLLAMESSVASVRPDGMGRGVRVAVHMVVAVMLELIGVACMVMFHVERRTQISAKYAHSEQIPQDISPEYLDTPVPRLSSKQATLAFCEESGVINALRRGEIQPHVREVMAHEHISQKAAQRRLAQLEDIGVLRREGRRYFVA